jgi:hypothetical protein
MTTAVFSSPRAVGGVLGVSRGNADEQNWVCKSDGGDVSEAWLSPADAPA